MHFYQVYQRQLAQSLAGDTASTATSFSQTQNNYLSHIERARMAKLKKEKSERSNSYGNCISVRCAEITAEIRALEKLDKARDKEFNIAYDNCRSGAGCEVFYGLHVTQRQEQNADAEKSFKENRDDWVLQEDSKNIFHNFDKNGKPSKLPNGKYRYKKYVHKNGQLEIIIDTKDGNINKGDYGRIVTDLTNAGSYNYYPPTDLLGHKDYDVDPYIDFGSGKGDKTSLNDRRNVPIADVFPTEVIFGELPPVVGMEGSIANDTIQKYINEALRDFEKEKKQYEEEKKPINYIFYAFVSFIYFLSL